MDSPNGCFTRWMLTAVMTLITLVFIFLARRSMQKIADRGGVRFKSTENSTSGFLLVLMFALTAYMALSIYKAVDCFI